MKIKTTKQFDKDRKRPQKRGKKLEKLKSIILELLVNEKLSPLHRDHKLKGDYLNHRECHIEPDWLLIYKKTAEYLFLVRTGTHADLF